MHLPLRVIFYSVINLEMVLTAHCKAANYSALLREEGFLRERCPSPCHRRVLCNKANCVGNYHKVQGPWDDYLPPRVWEAFNADQWNAESYRGDHATRRRDYSDPAHENAGGAQMEDLLKHSWESKEDTGMDLPPQPLQPTNSQHEQKEDSGQLWRRSADRRIQHPAGKQLLLFISKGWLCSKEKSSGEAPIQNHGVGWNLAEFCVLYNNVMNTITAPLHSRVQLTRNSCANFGYHLVSLFMRRTVRTRTDISRNWVIPYWSVVKRMHLYLGQDRNMHLIKDVHLTNGSYNYCICKCHSNMVAT